MRSVTFPLAAILVIDGLAATAHAQCGADFSSGLPQPRLTGRAYCSTLWDPDGLGPLPTRLVVGGTSLAGGTGHGQALMTWDGSVWETLGGSWTINGEVRAVTSWNGVLVAGGDFSVSGNVHDLAAWSGVAWQPLGAGFPVPVSSLGVWNGNLVAAGHSYSSIGPASVAIWSGASWTTLPAPPALHVPFALVSYQGLLCVAGDRSGVNQSGVLERWNGSSWSTSIIAQNTITCLAVRPNLAVGGTDTLYVGGAFNDIGGTAVPYLAVTSGGAAFAWSPLGSGLPSGCRALHVRNVGLGYVLVASTESPTAPVRKYTATFGTPAWSTMGDAEIQSLNYFAGSYHGMSIFSDAACQRWDGSAWVPVLGPGIDGQVRTVTRIGGDAAIGGAFTSADGTLQCIARWSGSTLLPIGSGISGTSVDALLTLANGDVVAGGSFAAAGGTSASHIARWNGSAWSSFGTGMDQPVLALAQLPNGDVVAGGRFTTAGGVPCNRIARWNGSAWSPFGSGMSDDVQSLAVRSDGVLFAGGKFTTASGAPCNHIAQWNGTQWFQVGGGCNGDVLALAVRPNNDVVAGGVFTSAGGFPASRCALWDGSAWTAMGVPSNDSSAVRAVLALPDGDVVAAKGFHAPLVYPDEGISRWNGGTWSAMRPLVAANATDHPAVSCLAQIADGTLVVGGDFQVAGYQLAPGLAKYASGCMPLVSSYGTGCISPAGPLVITADALPWIGTPFRTTTTGVPLGALSLGIIGLTQLSIPLDQLLAEGQAGCSLLTTLDILMLLTNGIGTAHSAFTLSNDPSLLGVTFCQQTAPLSFDAAGALVAIRSSNSLALTIGTL